MSRARLPREPRRLVQAVCRAAAGAAALLAVSCASVPERPPASWLGVLPEHAAMYGSLSVKPSLAMLKKALKEGGPAYNDVASLLDMTTRLYVAVSIPPEQPARFAAIALGGYPSAFVSMRLQSNKDWKIFKSAAGTWFEFKKGHLQLAFSGDNILLASNGDVDLLFPRLRGAAALPVPPEVSRDMETSDLVLYMPELPRTISPGSSGPARMPVDEVWMSARRTGDSYAVGGTCNLATEKQARVFAGILKIGLVAWMRTEKIPNIAERLKGIVVTPDGTQVTLTGLSFSEAEIIPVFLSLMSGAVPVGEKAAGDAGTKSP